MSVDIRALFLLALWFVASLLTGCASMSDFKEFQQKGDSIYLKASLADIQEAAILALADKRLTSPEIEAVGGGVVIYAEQGVASGMLFNSYGGFGKVTIAPNPELGDGIFAVSVITRSRAVVEPVGPSEALKGRNYNNPVVARQILEHIKGLVNAKARN